jgi:hypothetical protein
VTRVSITHAVTGGEVTVTIESDDDANIQHWVHEVLDAASRHRRAVRDSQAARNDHSFVGEQADCALCGEGRCHYLHDQDRSGEP